MQDLENAGLTEGYDEYLITSCHFFPI